VRSDLRALLIPPGDVGRGRSAAKRKGVTMGYVRARRKCEFPAQIRELKPAIFGLLGQSPPVSLICFTFKLTVALIYYVIPRCLFTWWSVFC
jgi:hypothetical protein